MALWALLHAPPLLLHTLTEYCTFIALLGSMYAITGAPVAWQLRSSLVRRSTVVCLSTVSMHTVSPFCPTCWNRDSW